MRKILVQALVLLRNRNVITASSLLTLFFKLFRIKDKKLRSVLYHHIVNDIRRLNSRKRDEKVNRALQNFMYTMLQDTTKVAARKSLEVMIELFRMGIWRDSKTVNVISTAIFSQDVKMVLAVVHFFLDPPKDGDDEKEDKDYRFNKRDIIKRFGHGVIKKTTKRKRRLREALTELSHKRKSQLKHRLDDRRNFNYAAVMLINDPQGYSEKVYRVLVKSTDRYETKIMLMALLSRLTASHQLVLLDFYSFIQKYLAPHQPHITNLMAIAAQSCHPLVTPEAIEPLIKAIAFNFVSDRRTNEAIVVGINTIREICLRCPLVMNAPLLADLLEYRTNKDKGIAMAAKSLLTLFRMLDPQMLPRKLRGKSDATGVMEQYGEQKVTRQIDGMDLLEQYKAGMMDDIDLQSDEDMSDISGEWIDVSSGEGEIDISLSDDGSGSSDESDEVDGEKEKEVKPKKAKKVSAAKSARMDEDANGEEAIAGSDEEDAANDGWETASDDPEELLRLMEKEENGEDISGSDDEEMDVDDDSEFGSDEDGEWISVTDSDEEGGEDDSDDDGEWVTASSDSEDDESDSSDEEGHERLHLLNRLAMAHDELASVDAASTTTSERLETMHVLTDEDFALIEKLKKARDEGKLDELLASERKKNKKRGFEYMTKVQDMRDEDIDVTAIEGFKKRVKLVKGEKMDVMKKNRNERLEELQDSRSSRKSKLRTNEAKKKNKAYQMVKHSDRVQRKKTRSMKDSSRVRGAAIKKLKTMDKSFKAKILRK